MTVYGFSDKGDAQRLKQIARASRPASARFHEALRTPRAFYICLAAGDIPAATLAGGQLTLGRGTAYVLWRDT